MAKIYIRDIKPNQDVASLFIVAEKQLRVARNGTPFLTLKLVDKTGEITGRLWEGANEAANAVTVKGVVSLKGQSELFRDELQLQIREVAPVSLQEIDPADFLPVSPENLEVLFEELKKLAGSVKRRPLHQFMRRIFEDRELMGRFRRAPAAKSMHHAYLGGLLEHTVSVTRLAHRICSHYPELDRDLLTAGAILHDIGKVHEFVYDLFIDYSDTGRLLGHMVLGMEIIEEKLRAVKGFPPGEALLLKHLVLSHHGEAEFGAVKLPMTREAFVLHFVDDLDAKMNSLSRILSEPGREDSAWTSYQQTYGRFFYRGLPITLDGGDAADTAASSLAEEAEKGSIQLPIWSAGVKRREQSG